jgi:maltose O-acetyltransferase
VEEPCNLPVGTDCYVGYAAFLDTAGTVSIGDRVALGPNGTVITAKYDYLVPEQRCGRMTSHEVRIGEGSWIAANALIGPGVVLGNGCVVAAGSVVLRSFPANTMVAGNPAQVETSAEPATARMRHTSRTNPSSPSNARACFRLCPALFDVARH